MLVIFLPLVMILLDTPEIGAVSLSRNINESNGTTQFSFELHFSMNFSNSTTQFAYFECNDVQSFIVEHSDMVMTLKTTDNSTSGEIKCKLLEEEAVINIKACNISIHSESNKTNIDHSIGYRFRFNKTTNYRFYRSYIHFDAGNNWEAQLKFTLHNASLQFQNVNKSCDIDNYYNITNGQFNSTDTIYFCQFPYTKQATESVTSGSPNALMSTTRADGTTPTSKANNPGSSPSASVDRQVPVTTDTAESVASETTRSGTTQTKQSSTTETSVSVSTKTTKQSTSRAVTTTRPTPSEDATPTNSAQSDTTKTNTTQTQLTKPSTSILNNSAQTDTTKTTAVLTSTTTTKLTTTSSAVDNDTQSTATHTDTPAAPTFNDSTSKSTARTDTTKTTAALTSLTTTKLTTTTLASVHVTQSSATHTDTPMAPTTKDSTSKSIAPTVTTKITAAPTESTTTNPPPKGSTSTTSSSTHKTTRDTTLTSTARTYTVSKETGSTKSTQTSLTTPGVGMQKKQFSLASKITITIVIFMAIPAIYKLYVILSHLKKSEETQSNTTGV